MNNNVDENIDNYDDDDNTYRHTEDSYGYPHPSAQVILLCGLGYSVIGHCH